MLLLLPIGLTVVGLNVWVDPAGLFHQDEERRIAAYQLEGLNVANVRNHDDRQCVRFYVEGLNEKKDVLAFGSSRSMILDSTLFPGRTFFNASVFAATLPDVVANFELFYMKGLTPRCVVVGVEPYMLNGNFNNRLYLRDAYEHAMDRLDLPYRDRVPLSARLISPRYRHIVSASYCQESVRNLHRLLEKGRPEPYPTTAFETRETMTRADGSLSYELSRRLRDQELIDTKARRFAHENPAELTNFHRLDPYLCRVFETFLSDLIARGIEVVFFMSPYHPVTYADVSTLEVYGRVGEAARYFEAFASEHGIPIIGSYDPAACSLTADDFYDAVHCSHEAVSRIFEQGPEKNG